MKIAIIGAGVSGLASIKSCLEEGLQPVCFEKSEGLGGLWQFSENAGSAANSGSVYESTVINTSKEMTCFSDFPAPKHFPPFMPRGHVVEYLRMYAEHFDLVKFIRFKSTVIEISRTPDYRKTGQWKVCHKDENANVLETIFDAVMICNGHLSKPFFPGFRGLDNFQGRKLHSHAYKSYRGYEGKVVLVVGLGNSAADIAVELSRHASQVYLSTHRGAWVISRLEKHGLPWDQRVETRFFQNLPPKLKGLLQRRNAEKRFDHATYGLLPKHGFLNAPSVISDDLPLRIATGTIELKPHISYFTKMGVVFSDGTRVNNLDAVISCTGYDISFEFLKDEYILPVKDNAVSLYKQVFPPHHPKSTLAVVGLIQSSGAFFPAAELQARWATRVFKGLARLPSREGMLHDIGLEKKMLTEVFFASRRLTIQVSSIPYKDQIADLIGCRPNLGRLFFRDPLLALKCYFGPCCAAQYRLMGPGARPEAKQIIEETYHKNMFQNVTRRNQTTETKNQTIVKLLKLVCLFATVATLKEICMDLNVEWNAVCGWLRAAR